MQFSNRVMRSLLCVSLAAGLCLPFGFAFADELSPQRSSESLPVGSDRPVPESVPNAEPDASDRSPVVGSAITDEEVDDVLAAFDEPASGSAFFQAVPYAPDADAVIRSGVITIAGETQYGTAAAEALFAFDSSEYAIVANGSGALDALSATALAGLLDCPILLTAASYVPDVTRDAIKTLGVKNIIVVGGASVVSDSTAAELGAASSSGTYTRVAGDDLYGTQLAIYEYGKQHGTWGKTAFVANGTLGYADALSVSPMAYKLKAPVFMVDSDGMLPVATARALIGGGFSEIVVAGGTSVVSDECWGIFQAASIMGGGDYDGVTRLGGSTLYETSAEVAKWAVSKGYLKWDGAAFAAGRIPYDALAGSAVQGREGSVLLLVDDGYGIAADTLVAADAATPVNTIKFFGGPIAIKPELRLDIAQRLDLANITVAERTYPISKDRFVDIEYEEAKKYHPSYTRELVAESIDPASAPSGSPEFYQFTVLSGGYSGMTAEQLDAFIADNCRYAERNNGCTSTLRGTGAYFIAAAQKYNVNEVYLLSHAILESGWGCSRLAQGKVKGYEGYYNFYGIGAYDADPNNGGAAMAKRHNWNSPESAIMGAAEWLSKNYINPTVSSGKVSGPQDTLWKMRWDVQRAVTDGSIWHQYATGRTWATGIAQVMDEFYRSVGVPFEKTGLAFEVPKFQQ